MKSEIEIVWKQVDETDYQEGMLAFERYRTLLDSIGEKYGHTLEQVTAAFVSLSPNSDFVGNVRSLITLLEASKRGLNHADVNTASFRACAKRAYDYLHGKDFLNWNRGPKIEAFYHCIMVPETRRYVVIDGHMVSIWKGRRILLEDVAKEGFEYQEVAVDFIQAAKEVKLRPNQLQAMLWFTWKRIHNIRYEGSQLKLYGDQWGIEMDPNKIKPFTKRGFEDDSRNTGDVAQRKQGETIHVGQDIHYEQHCIDFG